MGRVEAFSDGVIAIILTIMVLDLKVPQNTSFAALLGIWPTMLAYVLSFFVVAIMWVNHHHMLRTARHPDAPLLWANNVLLFWMSLIPFVTRYLGDNHAASLPVAVYAGELACTCMAFFWLQGVLAAHNRGNEALETQYRHMRLKSASTILMYWMAVPLAYWSVKLALVVLILMPILYFLPERKLLEA
jgi:uncharacterized membrane protein